MATLRDAPPDPDAAAAYMEGVGDRLGRLVKVAKATNPSVVIDRVAALSPGERAELLAAAVIVLAEGS